MADGMDEGTVFIERRLDPYIAYLSRYIASHIDHYIAYLSLENLINIVFRISTILINIMSIRKYAHHGWHVGLRKSGKVDEFVF